MVYIIKKFDLKLKNVISSVSEARTDDLVKDYIQQGMEQVNEEAISRSTRVK